MVDTWLRRESSGGGHTLFFYGYVGLLVIAGGWGIFFAPADQDLLLGLDLQALPAETQANVLSQYRFLRATELGFGLFLTIMAAGVLARLLSLAFDGAPAPWFYFFLASEFAGVVLIYAYTRSRKRGLP